MITCNLCGVKSKNSHNGKCQSCYLYFKKGGKINEKPCKGEMKKDERGFYICHICGMSFKRLGSHVKEKHDISIHDYKTKFDLCYNTRTTSDEYNLMMRNYALENNMDDQVLIVGLNTRLNPKGKKRRSCLQEAKERSQRLLKGSKT